ncbi:MAG: hypothetical protein DMF82_23735, partial [Acidobacteria bacterium]
MWEWHPQEGAPGGPGESSGDRNPLAPADYIDLRREKPGIESTAAYRYHDFVVTDAGEPERIPGFLVTVDYFPTLGLRPALGRTFSSEEEAPGRDAVAVVSHGFWQRHFGNDTSVVGRAAVLDGRRFEIVGVLPAGLNFPPGKPDVFAPLVISEAEKTQRGALSLGGIARLRESGSLAGAQASLDAFSSALARQYPDTNGGRRLRLGPLREMQTGFTGPFLALFQTAAAIVLLIVCANVAGLLVARGTRREREMALRAALGASRGRIVRQLLTEGLLLSFLAAAAALVIARVGVDLIRAGLPADLVRWVAGWSEIRMDGRTVAFTLALTVLTTLAFGLLPALRAARTDLVETLKAGARAVAGPPRRRLRGGLVALQVTLAFVLLSGAVLMTRGFLDVVRLYQGFDPDRVVTLALHLPQWQYPEPARIARFYEDVVRGLEASPGVEAAGVVSQLPADLGPIPRGSFTIEGRPPARPQEKPSADVQTISPGRHGWSRDGAGGGGEREPRSPILAGSGSARAPDAGRRGRAVAHGRRRRRRRAAVLVRSRAAAHALPSAGAIAAARDVPRRAQRPTGGGCGGGRARADPRGRSCPTRGGGPDDGDGRLRVGVVHTALGRAHG